MAVSYKNCFRKDQLTVECQITDQTPNLKGPLALSRYFFISFKTLFPAKTAATGAMSLAVPVTIQGNSEEPAGS